MSKQRHLRLPPIPMPLGAGPRDIIEAEIERLIALLDYVDPDPDLEPWLAGKPSAHACDAEHDDSDLEDGADDEPSLGSLDRAVDQRRWNTGCAADLEVEVRL